MTDAVTQALPRKRIFHTLNALRFFAIFKIFTQHLPFDDYYWLRYVKFGGTYFFFMLSGFLITYGIMEERLLTGKLNLKNFLARRALRIWPLFYLVVALCYIIPPILKYLEIRTTPSGYDAELWVSLLFLENYKMIITHSMPDVYALAGTWSICIQEHFYIIWGLVLLVLPTRHIPKLIIFSVGLGIGIRICFVQNELDPADIFSCLDIFAYGSIPAVLLIKHGPKLEEWVNNIPKIVQALYVIVLVTTVTIFAHGVGLVMKPILFGLLFSFLLILTFPPNAYIKISERNVFSRMGKVAYGIFAYHLFIIVACKKLCDYNGIPLNEPVSAIVFSIITFLLTVLCAFISYNYFEKPFLKLKKYFREGKTNSPQL